MEVITDKNSKGINGKCENNEIWIKYFKKNKVI
jgi:hypothetical protein